MVFSVDIKNNLPGFGATLPVANSPDEQFQNYMLGTAYGAKSLQELVDASIKMKDLRGSSSHNPGDASSGGFLGGVTNIIGNILNRDDNPNTTTPQQLPTTPGITGTPPAAINTTGVGTEPNFQPNTTSRYKDPSSYATNTNPQPYTPTNYSPNLAAPSPMSTISPA